MHWFDVSLCPKDVKVWMEEFWGFFRQLNQNKTEALVAGTEAMGVNLSAKLWALTSNSCQQVKAQGFIFDSDLGLQPRIRHKLRMHFVITRRLPECNFVSLEPVETLMRDFIACCRK